ncbi:MAG: DUF6067 family protein [Pirellulaceae bacterium]|nr:DUF6067 family protein [Pirellulaceae bacterium]
MQRIQLLLALICVGTALSEGACGYDLGDPSEPWTTARAGLVTEVPFPFESLDTNGNRVSIWGRTYELGSMLPAQIKNQGVTVFRRAPQVVIQAGGQRYELVEGTAVLGLDRPDRVEWTGERSAGTVRFRAAGWLEYDGVMRVDLTVSAEESTEVEYLGIEFPLVPDVARFIHYHTVWGKHDNLAVPNEVGDSLEFPWQSTWWLGDHDRGLTVFTENDFDWSNGPAAISIERRDDALVLRLNIWTQPRQLNTPVTFSIGLHPTPSKPLPRQWQARYVSFSGGKLLPASYTTMWHQNQKFYSYPQPADADGYRNSIEKKHQQNERVCPYFTPSGTSPDAPAVVRHYDDWIRTQKSGQPLWLSDSVDSGPSRNVCLCTASTFTDFMTWGMTKFLQTYEVDGLYFDNSCPYPCANTRHGCGRNGRVSYPIFANRAFFKRMYTILRQCRTDSQQPIIWQHNSRYMLSPALSFVDVYSDGEQFRFDKHSQPLADITPEFRAMTFTGVQWGAQPCFLPTMSSAKPWLTLWGMAATMPYGNILIPAPGWTDFTSQMGRLKKRQEFVQSSEQVRFYRPHELPSWVQVRIEVERDGNRVTGESVVGAYVRPEDQNVLLIVSNLSDEAGALRLHVAALAQQLGGRIEVADALTDAPSLRANADAYMRLSIAAHSCRMLHIYPLK